MSFSKMTLHKWMFYLRSNWLWHWTGSQNNWIVSNDSNIPIRTSIFIYTIYRNILITLKHTWNNESCGNEIFFWNRCILRSSYSISIVRLRLLITQTFPVESTVLIERPWVCFWIYNNILVHICVFHSFIIAIQQKL